MSRSTYRTDCQLIKYVSRNCGQALIMGTDDKPTRTGLSRDLGRLTSVMGSIRPTFERRQRLRQCLIMAGAESLPDYELLQVMLFTRDST
jgi:hypothetical protein